MSSRAILLLICALAIACGGSQASRTSEALFETPEAELAHRHAPDLYGQAKRAWADAETAERRRDEQAAHDRRTEARLWLAAAVAEAERVQLDRRRAELRAEEERWAKQLARDQEASAVVAQDISRYEARAVALREAERLSALSEDRSVNDATLDAVLNRVRLNLALAEALGADEQDLRALRQRIDQVARTRPESARIAEDLLLQSEALIGKTRAQWPAPQPGASMELVETARVTGFSADRLGSAVMVRSERFFKSGGQVSNATVKRFMGLLSAFPHGPVACQIAVPELRSRVWAQRVVQLEKRLGRGDDPGRVSTSAVATKSLRAGTVQCTFAAYREP